MGSLVSCCRCRKKPKRQIILLLVGLDNAGKTAAAKGLVGESPSAVVPTVGFSVLNIPYKKYQVKMYDLGGGLNIRGIWHKYFVDVHGVIFVVDSSDYSRFGEVKLVLEELLNHKKIAGKPLLILANKQDQDDALDEIDIIEQLDIENLANKSQCPTLVESCAANELNSKEKQDQGIKTGFDWLTKYIIRNYDDLNERVQLDMKEQEAVTNQEMLEKIQRIKSYKELEEKQRRKEQDENAIESFSEYSKKLNGAQENHRPKSAVQIVKEQLSHVKTRTTKSFRSNKTTPVNLFSNKPQSAKVKRKEFKLTRVLRSAGDAIRTVDLPNSVPIDQDRKKVSGTGNGFTNHGFGGSSADNVQVIYVEPKY